MRSDLITCDAASAACRQAVVVCLCNGTDYRESASHLQLQRAALLACSLRSAKSAIELVAMVRGFSMSSADHLRRAGFDRVIDVSHVPTSAFALSPLTRPPEYRKGELRNVDRTMARGAELPVGWGRKWIAQPVQDRQDGVCTTTKLLAWNLTEYDNVLCVDTDVVFSEDPSPWMRRHSERYFVARREVATRHYLGLNTHMFYLKPSQLLFRVLSDASTSGHYIPYTNTEQDVLESVFAPLAFPPLPRHVHTKGLWCDAESRQIMGCRATLRLDPELSEQAANLAGQPFGSVGAACSCSSSAFLVAQPRTRAREHACANLPSPMPNNGYTAALRTLDDLSLTRQPVTTHGGAEEVTHQTATRDGGEVGATLGTSPTRDHDIAIMCVGVLRGLRSPLQRARIAAFLDSIGPPERADVFAVFEELESDHSNVPTTDFNLKGMHQDEPCSAEERTRFFADVFGKGGRRAKMRMETAEEVEEARAKSWQPGLNAWALAQFHKIRLAFADVVAHERERGWSYKIVLRMRLDMTFPKLSVGWLGNRLANILTDDKIYLHNDYFFVGSRGAVAQFSGVWDHGIRLGLHLKGRSFAPIEWSRASESPWLWMAYCSNVFVMMDLPIDLFRDAHSLQRSGSSRIVQASQKQVIAERVTREWQTLEKLTAQGAFDPNRTFAVHTLQNYHFANVTDPSRYLDPEVFLAHVALHPSRPLGPLKLRCAVTDVLNQKGLSPRVFLRNASLSNTGSAGGCVVVRSPTCTLKPAPERWQWRC